MIYKEWINTTCETCDYCVRDFCRHKTYLSEFGCLIYARVANYGDYQKACSEHTIYNQKNYNMKIPIDRDIISKEHDKIQEEKRDEQTKGNKL